MTPSPAPGRPTRYLPVLLLFVAVFIAAINLRAGIASLGAVLDGVLTSFGAGGRLAGVVTAMPGLFFAVMGLAAVPLAARFGLSRMLTWGMVLTFIGLAARPWVGEFWLFIALTACVVVGIALANVLLPAWIKNHGGRSIVALMTVYTSVLGLSGALGPLSALLFHGDDAWRGALFVWAIFAAGQVVVWVVIAARTGFDFPSFARARVVPATPDVPESPEVPDGSDAAVASAPVAGAGPSARARVSLWRAPTAVFLMMFFGLQSMNAYFQMGWLPQVYIDSGVTASVASVALALVGALNIIGGLTMPTVIDRSRKLAIYPVVFSVFAAAGYLGLYLAADTWPLLWAFLLGLGGFCFPTAIALIPARSRTPLVTARVSGFVQPYGYFVAAAGPLVVGIVYGATGEWSAILLALVAATVLMAIAGYRASRRGFIDDELEAAA
ncbi:MFS transporter [Brevibacterium jeotgali]|uniref:MFS transporter, CP family, cyanate transporter n=1 Tax=Brevibacterium jeotgali TaxID=1262550 RepID=A0A2H1L7G2_9MICO|nr:MFS transporter [Brevibacterium jeotgali]TWB98867.1 CP family cyanate transporter-like MFS transporter [Brevibacterium jeotgali]SMY12303.1 MFS transporter, CP family, cyanate transporter [Brevibacterium jeotgali]